MKRVQFLATALIPKTNNVCKLRVLLRASLISLICCSLSSGLLQNQKTQLSTFQSIQNVCIHTFRPPQVPDQVVPQVESSLSIFSPGIMMMMYV
jgi:hypothetical protein